MHVQFLKYNDILLVIVFIHRIITCWLLNFSADKSIWWNEYVKMYRLRCTDLAKWIYSSKKKKKSNLLVSTYSFRRIYFNIHLVMCIKINVNDPSFRPIISPRRNSKPDYMFASNFYESLIFMTSKYHTIITIIIIIQLIYI